MQAFGYTVETMQIMLQPLVKELRDPLGSMGNDAALAVMSEKPELPPTMMNTIAMSTEKNACWENICASW